MGKVKIKVHHPPNLIPGIDIRCFALKTIYFRPKKTSYITILLFDPPEAPPGNPSSPKWVLELLFGVF